jgi:transposase InsO family protein
MSQAWFYKWCHGDPSPRHARRAQLAAKIEQLFAKHRSRYGSPRITADLRDQGWVVSVNTVAKIMRELGLRSRPRRRRKQTTRQGKGRWRAPDLIGRDFAADQLNRKWYGDGTELVTDEGKLYLDSVLDVASRRIVGFTIGEHHDTETAYGALAMAVAVRGGREAVAGVILHTDQGSEYTAHTFRAACIRTGIRQSMGRVGSALDKGLASHCTSRRGLGGNTVSQRAALACHEPGVAEGGRLEQPLVLVVGPVRGEQPDPVPALDGGGMHVQPFGDLGQGEQATGAEPGCVAGQRVRAA